MESFAWHVEGGEAHHDNEDCPEAQKVAAGQRLPGDGGLPLCSSCRELRIDRSDPSGRGA